MIDRRPLYRFHGRPFRTITGLYAALFADSGATTLSAIVNRRITGTVRQGEHRQVVATYLVSPPKLGEEMSVTREGSA